jgi:hypothetical protein
MRRSNKRHPRTASEGQSLVETAILLPLLLMLFLGLIEVGFAMYNYITIAGANREAARLASRGRFPDETVAARVVSAGGSREVSGVTEPYLRTTGADPNTGIIVTRVTIPAESGEEIQTTVYVSGTISVDGNLEPVDPSRAHLNSMSHDELLDYLNHRRTVAAEIDEYRTALDYEVLTAETYVIVETFFTHDLLTSGLPVIPDPLTLYFASTLRILDDSRID